MSYNNRLPRKIKKELKKVPEEWKKYLEERRVAKEREKSLDLIFTRDYSSMRKIFQKLRHK
jgi:hypothetical protein